MPRYDKDRKIWFCDGCGTTYPRKPEATACERRHKAIAEYKPGDELKVARLFGYDLSTTEAKRAAVEAVQIMISDIPRGGAYPTFEEKVPGRAPRPFVGGVGVPVGMTQIHGNGRTQIPVSIRKVLGLEDGDMIFWMDKEGTYYIVPAVEPSPRMVGKFSQKQE